MVLPSDGAVGGEESTAGYRGSVEDVLAQVIELSCDVIININYETCDVESSSSDEMGTYREVFKSDVWIYYMLIVSLSSNSSLWRFRDILV